MAEQATTKKFQGGERTRPAPAERAQKYYPAEDVSAPRKVRSIHHVQEEDYRIVKTYITTPMFYHRLWLWSQDIELEDSEWMVAGIMDNKLTYSF